MEVLGLEMVKRQDLKGIGVGIIKLYYIMALSRTMRGILVWPTCALMWRVGLKVFFVYTGAQSILSNPHYQSQKKRGYAGRYCLVVCDPLV